MSQILIIDDEPEILEVVSEFFINKGFEVKTSISGNSAIEILKNEKFEFIISDFRMSDGNGLAVLNFVNQLKPKPFFVFLSGQADISKEACLEAGANLFLSKPFDLEVLVSYINLINKK